MFPSPSPIPIFAAPPPAAETSSIVRVQQPALQPGSVFLPRNRWKQLAIPTLFRIYGDEFFLVFDGYSRLGHYCQPSNKQLRGYVLVAKAVDKQNGPHRDSASEFPALKIVFK